MPGLILDIYVQEKQQVQKGDVLLILEAMKMENAIKSAADGVIKSIKVSKRQSVEKNQLLLEFE
jgi:biotin carboxyl carrier protein